MSLSFESQTRSNMPPKLTKSFAARQLVEKIFKNGQITAAEDPKSVYESEPVFQQQKLDDFRVHYNNLEK